MMKFLIILVLKFVFNKDFPNYCLTLNGSVEQIKVTKLTKVSK